MGDTCAGIGGLARPGRGAARGARSWFDASCLFLCPSGALLFDAFADLSDLLARPERFAELCKFKFVIKIVHDECSGSCRLDQRNIQHGYIGSGDLSYR